MAVHVSIHDVAPPFVDEVELALEYAAAVGVKPALLVVPNFHGGAPLLDDARLCERLRGLQASGHEIYLHGFYHRARSADFFRQRVVSAGEAEFSDVTREEANERLDEGRRVLERAGLRVDGFIAPAWSMPKWLLPLLGERGVRFTEDHLKIYDPVAKRARASVVLNWASRSPGRLASTVAYCRVAKHARALFPARIAIHPGDMRSRLLRHEVRALLDWARGDCVSRGGELLA